MRIALLEDDDNQAQWMTHVLEQAGHSVRAFATGRALLTDLSHESYDVLVLDWEVPDGSGLESLQAFRSRRDGVTPVLFLTHRDSEEDIVLALSAGADDYVVKPPRERELLARIAALGRRSLSDRAESLLAVPPYEFDLQARVASLRGVPIELSPREFALALFLFQRLGTVVSRAHVLETVWGRGANTTTRTVDTHVSRLRTALALGPENGVRLSPVYGYGYRLESVADRANA
jgi:DNA-binding response OmpR family regulator